MASQQYETVEFDVRDRKGYLTLNRPESHNAFDRRMQLEVRDVWERCKSDDEVRVVVLTGAGDRAFCTGIDRRQGTGPLTWEREYWQREDPSFYLSPKVCRMWKPVVCAVNGMACGGAFYFLGDADIVIAAEHATFFDPHVTYAATAVIEPIMLAKRNLPLGEVLRMVLLGSEERLSARTAQRLGLVSDVVPAGELLAEADRLADVIAARDPSAVQGSLRAVWAALDMHRGVAMDVGFHLAMTGNDHADMAGAMAAFASGQRPGFRVR